MAIKMKSLASSANLSGRKKKIKPVGSRLRRKQDLPWKSSKSQSLLQEKTIEEVGKKFFRRQTDLDSLKELNDSDLIGVIHHQNREAYRELFARYQKKLFVYIYHLVGNREETEDILQNVFSKTYKNIDHFDVTRKFSSWIYRIAHNESINFLKRKSKRYTVSWEDVSTSKDKLDSASNEELPEDRIGHQEIVREIDQALKKISPRYQQILRLRYFEENSYEEIGQILGKPINTVGTLINRAKKKLLEVVSEEGKK